MGTPMEDAEEKLLFGDSTGEDKAVHVFNSRGSAGSNPIKLAQIVTSFDLAMSLLGWEKKPLANFTGFLTRYQASVGGGYHNDYKEILIAEEKERRNANKKGTSLSILQ